MARYVDLLTIVLVNLAALGGFVWLLRDPRAGAVLVEPPPTVTPAPSATPGRLHVYVSGAVASPGVVRLPEGARAGEAVSAAGGLAADAQSAAVNLAAPLQDGEHLHVPALGEAAPSSAPGPADSGAGGAPPAGAADGARIDINAADAATLESLPGIGPALAQRIVEHRAAKGPFRSVEDLLDVSGIGERTLARFRERIEVR